MKNKELQEKLEQMELKLLQQKDKAYQADKEKE